MYTDTVDMIVESTKGFYKDLQEDPNGRYRSWEHCYYDFYHARGNKNADIDHLSLQLAFYLASWGMYRGSSFLLWKDYKVHTPVVEEILKEKYDTLMGIKSVELKEAYNQNLLSKLYDFINDYYKNIRETIKEGVKSDVSPILITKVLMGTMGCVPAYDRFFIAGIKNQKVASGNYNLKSVLQLVDFYEENKSILEPVRTEMKVDDGLLYPQMKLLDMGFWKIGVGLEVNKGTKSD